MKDAINFPIPSDIPTPIYQLFQKVSYEGRDMTIVGIQYTSPLTALKTGWGTPGWEYTLDEFYGKSVEQVLRMYEELETVSEKGLKGAVDHGN